MRRKGAKGSYDFERISWDEAYDIIVTKLQSVKAESGAGSHGHLYREREL